MCEQLAQGCYLAVHRVGLKLATFGLQVRHATVTPLSHSILIYDKLQTTMTYCILQQQLLVLCVVVSLAGQPVSPGTTSNAVCGDAVSLICTLLNCSSQQLTGVTVEVQSVELIPACSAKSSDANRRAVFANSVLAVGCLMSSFSQVSHFLLVGF